MLPVLWYRRLRFGYAFRRIPLSQGKFAIIDPEDYPRLSKYKWYAVKHGRSIYAVRTVSAGTRKRHKLMHREIIELPKWKLCDHINHNGLDNRKANLRAVSRMENVWNTRKRQGETSSKYKGVSLFYNQKVWQGRIQANGKTIFLGNFVDEIDAAKAYDKAAKKYHREFAVLNFPVSPSR